MSEETRFPCIVSEPLKLPKPPVRASEAFLSTIAQGMWAEEKIMEAINRTRHLVAIRYGQSRYNHELISSKDAWLKYVKKVYEQMSEFGKRPDILVFKREEVEEELPPDISEEDEENVKDIVFKAIAGIECRSSSYYYDNYIKARKEKELSITVKDEDLERINKWRKTYCGSKPVYYVQVFFDKGFYLSYDDILRIIAQGKTKSLPYYRFEVDRKTQKATHFIGMKYAKLCLTSIESPTIDAEPIRAWDGRVYAIRSPKGGSYKLTDEFIKELMSLNIE